MFAADDLAGELAAWLATELPPGDPLPAIRRLLDPAAAEATLHWGRNYLWAARLPLASGAALPVVVKQFRHDGWRARWRRRLGGSAAAKSWRMARHLRAHGLPTPQPLLLAESRAPRGPAYYVCARIEGAVEARHLVRAMNAGEERERFPGFDTAAFLGALGGLLRRLHEAGVWHRDVSVGNLLVEPAPAAAAGAVPAIHLLDLNRARRRPAGLTLSERTRDLCRLALASREHQELLLAAYWGGTPAAARRRLYRLYKASFEARQAAKRALRGGSGRSLKTLLVGRAAHPHIPAAPPAAATRDRAVWDSLSDQPHLHAGQLQKLGVRLADAPSHLRSVATVLTALPRIRRRYRELTAARLERDAAAAAGSASGTPWGGVGIALRPWPGESERLLGELADLGVRQLLLRLHPWEEDHAAEVELARELHRRGYELAFALPQNRELVRAPARWRAAVAALAALFSPYGRHFQIGQAVNRSKWGVWTLGEYLRLAGPAAELVRAASPGNEVLGPGVIDFELHATAAIVNAADCPPFDALASLLYVDRRGAPENRQAGYDTVDKVTWLKAIADTARRCAPRSWITEVNWPLREGPHSPAGRAVAVDEERQADYLVRYYLAALGSGLAERVYWWQLVSRGYGLVDPAGGGGAPEAGSRRRPAFHALATLQRELAGLVCHGRIPAPPGVRLYSFGGPQGSLLVGWSVGDPEPARLPAAPASVVSRDGEERVTAAAAGAEVVLTSAPQYFRVPAF